MQIFDEVGGSMRLQPFALAKIAIALAIRDKFVFESDSKKTDNDGLELNRQTITGEYDDLFKAMIINSIKKPLTDEEYFPTYLKAYLDHGADLLYSEYKYSGSKFYQHLINLDNSI